MTLDFESVNRLVAGNVAYGLLIISMMMTRMKMLRIFGIASGVVSLGYSIVWLHDPVLAFWDTAFTLVNIVQLVRATYGNMWASFNGKERMFYERVVPELEPYQVRHLLNAGKWLDADIGVELTRQGESVPQLVFLQSGKVCVVVNNNPVSTCAAGSLIGEISISTGSPATATVVVQEPIHYLAIQRDDLQKISAGDEGIARAIDHGNIRNLEDKLSKMNRGLSQQA